MAAYSIVDAKNCFASLVVKAEQGEEVVITKRGKVVAELRPRTEAPRLTPEERRRWSDWITRRREERPAVTIGVVELFDQMYEGDED